MSQTTQPDIGAEQPAGRAVIRALLRTRLKSTREGPGMAPAVPGSSGFIALLEAFRATGGSVPADVVGHLLQERRAGRTVSLARLIHSGGVFGFEWRARLWIPMFQFDADDLAVKSGVERVRAELPSPWSGWTLASWFAGPNARLGGRRPADVLDSDLEAVVQAARSLKLADESVLSPARRGHEVAAHV